ncbi:MerR family transcriptional regulator [Paracoccus caeni]|uniref:MerR family transcriptional regulator n=1 Tax=Paracoccus caeni TaxID=657651 RepID=A0A934W151_9RHOB|nr:MerR family transcriptional regulator [Paracoccus caeni]MBK4216449.1 MerR family transcriptional regulator [Paracoccus caeni]
MRKGAEAFRSIGEVAKLIGVAPHVLRYWETQFSLLKPMKRPDGRRYYRPDDVRLAAGLCEILRDEGLTIRGAKKMLAKDRGQSVRARGAERLSELGILAEPDADVEEVADTAETTAQPIIETPSEPTFLPDPPVAQPREAAAQPNRPRKRRTLPVIGVLPLFPELDKAPVDVQWLARLVSLSEALHDTRPQDRGWQRARPLGASLNDAIARLY